MCSAVIQVEVTIPTHTKYLDLIGSIGERIVKELEKGDLPLERSLSLFESGMKLSGECKKMLEEAETRVEILTRRGGETVAVPFSPDKLQK